MSRRTGSEAVAVKAWKRLLEDSQAAILGAEVVAPGADAVGFVDRRERDVRLGQELEGPRHEQPLGSDVEQFERPAADLARDVATLLGREGAVDRRGRHAALPQRVDLVLHQRNERRHDDRQPVTTKGRDLKAETLPPASGKHRHRVATPHDAGHRLALQGPKFVVPPVAPHRGQQRLSKRSTFDRQNASPPRYPRPRQPPTRTSYPQIAGQAMQPAESHPLHRTLQDRPGRPLSPAPPSSIRMKTTVLATSH